MGFMGGETHHFGRIDACPTAVILWVKHTEFLGIPSCRVQKWNVCSGPSGTSQTAGTPCKGSIIAGEREERRLYFWPHRPCYSRPLLLSKQHELLMPDYSD